MFNESDDSNEIIISIYKPDSEQINYMDIKRILDPSEKFVNEIYNYENIEKKIKEYIIKGFEPIYTCNITYYDEYDLIYGCLNIGSSFYFVILDAPGSSGYGCCGCYTVYYSENLTKFLEEQEFIHVKNNESKKHERLLKSLLLMRR
jgi:hypothetical protein